jgi:hypothetical protein
MLTDWANTYMNNIHEHLQRTYYVLIYKLTIEKRWDDVNRITSKRFTAATWEFNLRTA